MNEEERIKGVVKWFNGGKGYGFINREVGKDIFVHVTNVKGEQIEEGDQVEFEITEGKKGLEAVKVRKIEDTSQFKLPLEEEEEIEEEGK